MIWCILLISPTFLYLATEVAQDLRKYILEIYNDFLSHDGLVCVIYGLCIYVHIYIPFVFMYMYMYVVHVYVLFSMQTKPLAKHLCSYKSLKMYATHSTKT